MRGNDMRFNDSDGVLRSMLRKTVRHASRSKRSSVQGVALPQPKGWFSKCQRCGHEIFAPSPYVVCMRMTDHVLEEHALECAFCFLRFRDFAALAEHVNEAHRSETERRNSEFTKSKRETREFQTSETGSHGRRL
jgi:uncharacterized C2H2 Zn-finger protein